MRTKQQSGFTLVELAVVVFLVGIMASVGLAALNAQMTSASVSSTKKKQEIIKDALIAYLGMNKRLPCPAIDNSGQESRITANTPADCTHTGAVGSGYLGILPYATLGLSKSTALDGQENFFSYAVSKQWTLTYSTAPAVLGGTSTNTASDAFNVGILGTLTINDRSPATNPTPTTISSAAVFIVSHGKNGLGALTTKGTYNVPPVAGTDELKNVPVPTTWLSPAAFYQRGYTDVDVPTYGAFDDIALVLSPRDITTPLIKDGALKSAQGQWAEQIDNINSALIGAMFNNSNGRCEPPADQTAFNSILSSNGIPTVDPWGGALTYTKGGFCRLNKDGSYKTSDCGNDCGACSTPSTSFLAFTVATSTSTPVVTIRPQTLSALTATNPSLLDGCPSP